MISYLTQLVLHLEIILKPEKRGFLLITQDIEDAIPELEQISIGMMNLFIKRTSMRMQTSLYAQTWKNIST